MRLTPPPAAQPPGTPVLDVLPTGTVLWRVHGEYAADSFNPTARPSARAGGRFDSLDGSYAYTYLGQNPEAALAETLCRDLPLDGRARSVRRSALTGRTLSGVEITRDLSVLVLHGAALSQVGAPLDLTKSEAREYRTTRTWAHALRTWLPQVAGFRYRCRHDEDLHAYVLFDDGPSAVNPRARAALRSAPGVSVDLTSVAGEYVVRRVLRRHNASLG